MKYDIERLSWWVQADAVTQTQKDAWVIISQLLIDYGRVEPLTEQGTLQAVDRLSYEIATMSLKLFLENPTAAEFIEEDQDEETKATINQMDEILLTIAYGSKIHKDIIDLMVSERTSYYVDQLVEKYKEQR